MDSGVTKRGAIRKRTPPNRIGKTPISLATPSDADKMLFTMREEGRPWPEICEAWKTMTGEDPKPSTLPNRYPRLKANFMTLKGGDVRDPSSLPQCDLL